ncbi:asparagine synthase (glutamine-hydrolyzing) [Propylenella binzhouense]|uniref:asparagine synthase (glutamine-hydrolyzing) n=1 Tax=Propylenella binzhouense TaxID=2555902 RepID=A0A964WUW0_9HYPH|nr:asparagine synthase (glutamine-hydrolyzing) [Propylenella binzhouense]MYZ49552.1 asparagine synthase (glutamine-hydrolyzing) [Propylenella binzhouense]
MCGLAGFSGTSLPDAERRRVLGRMIGSIAHRGPDGQGFHVDAEGAALGHCRLSIIDIAGGDQPICNEDGTVWIAFNGEIFNYLELRADLLARGHVFRTHSDTEVIVHLYEERGPDCVEALNGDFAFAIWDGRARRLMLARDRMGVRPLFYAEHRGGLFFGSEAKALLAAGLPGEIDPVALDQIFTFWSPLPPRTIFRGINELPPAHLLLADDKGVSVRRYWSLDYPDAGEGSGASQSRERRLRDELAGLLADSTRIRLRADVPVGAYLSGGLDSSVITTLMKELVPERLRTYSVAFESGEFDESRFQDEMVQALGTTHKAVRIGAAEIGTMLPAVVRHAERPILRTAPAPLMALSRLVRDDGLKVVLTGEGADEALAGYDIFKEAKIRRFCAAQPDSARRSLLLKRLYPYLPRIQGQSQRYLETFFGFRADDAQDPLFSHLPRFRTTGGAKAFFSRSLRASLAGYDALADLREQLPAAFGSWHPLNQAQYLETAYLLPGYILSAQGDRMAMANGVEGRFPFLDHRLVEFAARIPPDLKLKVLREKHLLRESMKGRLPPSILNRTKQPYRAPDADAFAGPGAPAYAARLLDPAAIAGGGLFDPHAVAKLAAKHAGRGSLGTRESMALVGILTTALWQDAFASRAPAAANTMRASA